MIGRRRHRRSADDAVTDDEVLRDAEESLVAALQESDTAVEAIHDSGSDAAEGRDRRWKIGAAGVLLALLGVMVTRRRR